MRINSDPFHFVWWCATGTVAVYCVWPSKCLNASCDGQVTSLLISWLRAYG